MTGFRACPKSWILSRREPECEESPYKHRLEMIGIEPPPNLGFWALVRREPEFEESPYKRRLKMTCFKASPKSRILGLTGCETWQRWSIQKRHESIMNMNFDEYEFMIDS